MAIGILGRRGPLAQVSHIFSSQAKIAFLYWRQYQHTQDRGFLRDRAYPMLKGVAEFYRNFPNLRKEANGKYHIHEVNNSRTRVGCHGHTGRDVGHARHAACRHPRL